MYYVEPGLEGTERRQMASWHRGGKWSMPKEASWAEALEKIGAELIGAVT